MENHQEQIQELQILEQNLNAFMMQKQSFQMELSETASALEEIQKSKDDVYKIFGQLMLKVPKEKALKELEDKQKLLNLRVESLQRQEKEFLKKADQLRKEIFKK
jgi:prefoldin beta subunit